MKPVTAAKQKTTRKETRAARKPVENIQALSRAEAILVNECLGTLKKAWEGVCLHASACQDRSEDCELGESQKEFFRDAQVEARQYAMGLLELGMHISNHGAQRISKGGMGK